MINLEGDLIYSCPYKLAVAGKIKLKSNHDKLERK